MSHYYYFLYTPELRRNSLGLIPELSHVWNLTGSLTIEVLFLLRLFNEKEGERKREEVVYLVTITDTQRVKRMVIWPR